MLLSRKETVSITEFRFSIPRRWETRDVRKGYKMVHGWKGRWHGSKVKREKGSLLTREGRDCRKILTYPNDIRKSRGVGGEERQQEPPRSHFRFRSAPPSLPPPATPPPPPAPPAWEPAPPPFCRGDSHRWKTRWDGEFIKMRRANLRVRPSNISPGEEKRAEKGGGRLRAVSRWHRNDRRATD